ncbi:MAG: hypothetical protein M3430_02480, partial [Acidobacteriota bacterium]|nr:hypothetical protein [Acidobacteriota bacterium]
MILTSRSPVAPALAALALVTLLILPTYTIAAPKKSSKPTPKKVARQEKSRPAKGREKTAAKSKSSAKSAKDTRAERRERDRAGKSRDRRGERASKNDRRSAREEKRDRASSKKVDTKSGRKLSRRERLAEARREAERRRREEAARRAEIARQAAIARALAIARQRAADQALRDETAANILRDDPTGEDLEVRRVAVEALGDRAGSVVVMDPK